MIFRDINGYLSHFPTKGSWPVRIRQIRETKCMPYTYIIYSNGFYMSKFGYARGTINIPIHLDDSMACIGEISQSLMYFICAERIN